MELFEEAQMLRWMDRIEEIAATLGLQVERKGNNIDMIFGKSDRSVTRYEFFRFQKNFESLNQEMNFRMSGVLWLMPSGESRGDVLAFPFERYVRGVLQSGDSIGRPSRHRIKKDKHP